MKKKNIAILIPKLAGGGAERVASNLSIYLDEEKFNKYVIVYDSNEQTYDYGGKLIDLNAKAINNPIGKIYNLFKRVMKMRKFKKENNIDVTISLLSGPNLVNILSKKDDKVFVSVRNFISKSAKGFYGNIYKFSINNLYNKADKVISVSKAIADDLIKNYNIEKNKIKVIYNPYDINKIQKLSQEKINDEYKEIFEKPTIINMGRLSEQKGQWHLLRAFKKVETEIKDAQLVILGKGELEKYLKKLANDLELSERVHFLGFQNNPFKYIANSDLYVFPSLFEGFPNALVEAMACKISVLSADCKSGPREILAPDTNINKKINDIKYAKYGVLFPVLNNRKLFNLDRMTKNEEKLSKIIRKFMEDKDLRRKYGELAYSRVEDFSFNNIIKLWEKEIS